MLLSDIVELNRSNLTKMKRFFVAPFFGLLAVVATTLAAQADMGTVIGIDLGTTYSW